MDCRGPQWTAVASTITRNSLHCWIIACPLHGCQATVSGLFDFWWRGRRIVVSFMVPTRRPHACQADAPVHHAGPVQHRQAYCRAKYRRMVHGVVLSNTDGKREREVGERGRREGGPPARVCNLLSAVWLRHTDPNAATSNAGRLPGVPPADCQKHAAHVGTCDGAAEGQESVCVCGESAACCQFSMQGQHAVGAVGASFHAASNDYNVHILGTQQFGASYKLTLSKSSARC